MVLGDSCMYQRTNARGSVMQLTQGEKNYHYLLFVWNALHDKGLTTDKVPDLKERTTNYGLYKYAKFQTYTLPALNWINYSFYVSHSCMEYSFKTGTFTFKTSKIVPPFISDYLSPLALAVWFMDDGYQAGNTFGISTQSYSLSDVNLLCKVLYDKYGIVAHSQRQRDKKQLMLDGSLCHVTQYIIYINTMSASRFSDIIKPYIVPSMLYKLGL